MSATSHIPNTDVRKWLRHAVECMDLIVATGPSGAPGNKCKATHERLVRNFEATGYVFLRMLDGAVESQGGQIGSLSTSLFERLKFVEQLKTFSDQPRKAMANVIIFGFYFHAFRPAGVPRRSLAKSVDFALKTLVYIGRTNKDCSWIRNGRPPDCDELQIIRGMAISIAAFARSTRGRKARAIDQLVSDAIQPIAHLLRGKGDVNTVSRWVRKFNKKGLNTRRVGGNLYDEEAKLVRSLDLSVFEYSKANFEHLTFRLDGNTTTVIDQMLELLREMVHDLALKHPKIVT